MGRKSLTTQEFIERAKKYHNNKFDYSKVEYKTLEDKICIICPVHGEFWTQPGIHLHCDCPKCAKETANNKKTLTTENFIKKAIEMYGNDLYDFSKVVYKNWNIKILIHCNVHNHTFKRIPNSFLKGNECPLCIKEKEKLKNFLEKVKGNYDIFDYSLVKFNGNKKIEIICKKHNISFFQRPDNHLKGFTSCPLCKSENISKYNKPNTKKFIENAKLKHGSKYNYSKTIYKGPFEKICVICPEHGEFYIQARYFLAQKYPCKKCSLNEKRDDFIKNAILKHGNKFDYSEVVFTMSIDQVKIKCNKHNEYFYQSPTNHLISNISCPICESEYMQPLRSMGLDEFIRKAKIVHGDLYDYSKFVYTNNRNKSVIICKKHNFEFLQTPHNHLSGKGCKMCSNSKGEKTISDILTKYNIKFECEKTFNNCKNPLTNRKLRFDFYLPNFNIAIEFDGSFHFSESKFHKHESASLENLQYRDSIKNKYCEDNNIKLIRIPYWEYKNIEEILKRELNL